MLDDTINDTSDLTPNDDIVAARWEACERFVTDADGSPVCAACGWLEDEHGTDAVVHQLPRPVSSSRLLAS